MGKTKKTLPANKIYFLLLIVTLLIGLPPFVLYGSARLTGEIPSFQEWQRSLDVHGPWSTPRTFVPWWASWKGDLIVYSALLMVILLFVTFLLSIILGFTASKKRFFNLIKGVGLVLLQLLWAYMIIITMAWTID